MIRKLFFILGFLTCSANAADAPRVNVFSTSVDWEAVTGLRLRQMDIEFVPDAKLVGNIGLEIYVLDGFPCYGQPDRTQMWFGPNGRTRNGIRIVCLHAPDTLNFAWRTAGRDALQDTTTGILTCPVDKFGQVKMADCAKGKEWSELR